MIEPLKSDQAFLDEVRETDARQCVAVWWLGQSGFLVKHRDTHLVIDPYLSDSLTVKYAQTDKPHVRMTRRVVAPEALDFIDVVTSSHNHTDHLDGETLRPLLHANPDLKVLIPETNRAFAADRLRIDPQRLIGLDDGQDTELCGIRIWAVPAAHESLDRDPQGRCPYLGYVFQLGRWKIYHSGDTILYPGMVERLEPHAVSLALLPINGRLPERRVAGNLWGREAAQLARDIRAQRVVPCHYDMFEFNTETPDEFTATCRELGQPYRVLQNGERLELE